jgi:hypothetical protein
MNRKSSVTVPARGIPYGTWAAIQKEILRLIKVNVPPNMTQGAVVANDTLRNIVWLEEFGSQPIPIFGFPYTVEYYDTQPDGAIIKRSVVVTPTCPDVGDIVLVARQYGSRRLPKCVGVLQSTDFVLPT